LLAAVALAWSVAAVRNETIKLLASEPARTGGVAPNSVEEGQVAKTEALKLSNRSDVPLLLTRIERAATDAGLPWTAADYRVIGSSERQPMTLEIRCSFKAPYPKLRAMIVQVLSSVPAVTFRELAFSRASVESADVDVKMSIAVFLADDDAGIGRTKGAR
jgi:hypothetical protein